LGAELLLSNAQGNGPGNALDVRDANEALFVVTGEFNARVRWEFSVADSPGPSDWYPYVGRVNNSRGEDSFTDRPCRVMFSVEPIAWLRPYVYDYQSGTVTVVGYVEARRGRTRVLGTPVLDAGKKTDADTTDRVIDPGGVFNQVSVINEGPSELRLCVDGDSTGTSKIIYVKDGEAFAEAIQGSTLHYSVASGSATFRYLLR